MIHLSYADNSEETLPLPAPDSLHARALRAASEAEAQAAERVKAREEREAQERLDQHLRRAGETAAAARTVFNAEAIPVPLARLAKGDEGWCETPDGILLRAWVYQRDGFRFDVGLRCLACDALRGTQRNAESPGTAYDLATLGLALQAFETQECLRCKGTRLEAEMATYEQIEDAYEAPQAESPAHTRPLDRVVQALRELHADWHIADGERD